MLKRDALEDIVNVDNVGGVRKRAPAAIMTKCIVMAGMHGQFERVHYIADAFAEKSMGANDRRNVRYAFAINTAGYIV